MRIRPVSSPRHLKRTCSSPAHGFRHRSSTGMRRCPAHGPGQAVDLSRGTGAGLGPPFVAAPGQQRLRIALRPAPADTGPPTPAARCCPSRPATGRTGGHAGTRTLTERPNLHAQPMTWGECQPLAADFCAQVMECADKPTSGTATRSVTTDGWTTETRRVPPELDEDRTPSRTGASSRRVRHTRRYQ